MSFAASYVLMWHYPTSIVINHALYKQLTSCSWHGNYKEGYRNSAGERTPFIVEDGNAQEHAEVICQQEGTAACKQSNVFKE